VNPIGELWMSHSGWKSEHRKIFGTVLLVECPETK